MNEINKFKPVLPKPSVNRLIQHRLAEKDFVNKLNIRTTRYVSIEKKSDIEALEDFLPGILKTTTLGYDGKGQYPIKSGDELNSLNIDFSKGYILEKLVKLKKEISIIITRFSNNKYEIYEPIENLHEDQILKYSKIPANISTEILKKSTDWAKIISEELDYIGTLCVEYFVDKSGGYKKFAADESIYVLHPNGESQLYRSKRNIFESRPKSEMQIYPGSIIIVPRALDESAPRRLATQAYVSILGNLGIALASLSAIND